MHNVSKLLGIVIMASAPFLSVYAATATVSSYVSSPQSTGGTTSGSTPGSTGGATSPTDISRHDATQAIINYEASARAKENAAAAADKYAPPPLLSVTLAKSQNAYQAFSLMNQNNPAILNRMISGSISGSILPFEFVESLPAPVGASFDLSLHYSLFCLDQELGMIATTSCQSVQGMQGADLNVANLLNTNRLDDTNTVQLAAVDNLIRNITELNYSQMVGLANGTVGSLPAGRQEQLRRRLNQVAQSSVAMNSFANMLAERMPQQFAPFITGYTPGSGAAPAKLQQSMLEVIQEESTRRFLDPTWTSQMMQASDSAMVREMANMESFRLYMDFMRYQQMERVEALLATLLSTQLNVLRTIPFQPQQPVPTSVPPSGGQ